MTSFVWVQGLHQSNPPQKLLDGWQAVRPPLNTQRGTRCGHGRAAQPYVWTRTRIQVLLPSDLCPPDHLSLTSPWHLLSLMGRCWNTRSERAFFHLTLESFLVHKENAPRDRSRSTEKTGMWRKIRQELNISVKTNCCGVLHCGYLKRTAVILRCACVCVYLFLGSSEQTICGHRHIYTYREHINDRLNKNKC